ncbi:UV DNA damage repair endonuclease UvsE [Lichenihabitans sp. Uapishka_5]|uniref:UV DNA damage repair endonuclease UvsE n=1 Tax=Lichenihabitans sp. Uapishka_5 TaxID=3037302 RepID=UPI0029E81458|nr:UV DNA damage repair endonuclease UvsE [Lichenihabitans sp. Uapishka_5]MDX7951884.1 UV DNA damage repair endonuclease UvsE [Lichenihabitans sp. Uapishka_5]
MGKPDLKSNDTRRWQQNPHLKTSIGYIETILDFLAKRDIRMYRMSSDLAPYATHPDMPQFHGMVGESRTELAALGRKARELDMRLSFHPSQFVVLNSPDPELVKKSVWDLTSQAEMLDLMELGPEAVMVIHVGGTYGDRPASNARWVETWATLPEPVRRRLVLEHDDLRFSAADVLWIHEHTGVRLIFDHQHFWCFNPEKLDMMDAVRRILASWPEGQIPKIHFSSPRTEMRELKRRDRTTKKLKTVQVPPVWTGHADFVHPFEFLGFMRDAKDMAFDVMLEAKVKDLALMRLRPDMLRYGPDVAADFGLTPADSARLAEDEEAMAEVDLEAAEA